MTENNKTNTDIFKKAPDLGYVEEALPVNFHEFEQVVRSRRSVRVFDGTPIPEDVVKKCLDLTLLSPNSSNLQQWEFYWVRSPKPRRALKNACLGQPAATTAAELFVAVARTRTWRKHATQVLEKMKAGGSVPKSVEVYYTKIAPLAYDNGFLGWKGLIKRVIIAFRGIKVPTPREPTK